MSIAVACLFQLDIECRKKEKAEIQDMISRAEQIYSDRLGFKISKVRGSGAYQIFGLDEL